MSEMLPIARLGVQLLASVSVAKVLSDIVKNNTTVVTTADAVRVWTGTVVLGTIISEHACNQLNAKMDQAIAWHESRKTETTTEK